MKKLILIFFAVLSLLNGYSQNLTYHLKMSEPHTHYFEVEIEVNNNKDKTLDFKMPVWAPGSYMVREFAKNVDWFSAKGDDKELSWNKTDKNTWRVNTNGAKKVSVSYKVYAYELSVRTSFLDASHGFVSGSGVFMYIDKKKHLSGQLLIWPHKSFSQISTGLERMFAKNNEFNAPNNIYLFPDYDVLADSPIEIGNQEIFHFNAAGVEHEVCMYGKGNYNVEQLQKDMALIVESATKVYGENPNSRYVFIIHNVTVSSGGLEHLNSTTLEVNRWSYSGSSYLGFLSLVAHEYFHLWNVKRLRPNTLGPFDYDNENYTTLLWVMEGFTSYYDELLLKRSGFYDQKEYLKTLSQTINAIENRPGSKVQSMAESSFDAWIKGYRPNENSVNTQISYYTKGQLLGALLDMEIIASTNGEKKLDDLMKYLYNEYYKKLKRGMTEQEFRLAAEKIAGKKLDRFFNDYVYSTKEIDYAAIFQPLGLELQKTAAGDPINMGMRVADAGGQLIIKEITEGGSAYHSGLNVNDEIISIDGFRVNSAGYSKAIAMKKPNESAKFMISRDNVMMELDIKLLPGNQYSYQAIVTVQSNVTQEKLLNKWLN